jgi:SAM-dependent methyltransferase
VKEPYRPEAYWEERFSKKLDISIVGHSRLGYIYNGWLYRRRLHALRRALRKLNLDVRRKSVIEIGVGSGAYLPLWKSLGVASITGLDITAASVALLSQRFPPTGRCEVENPRKGNNVPEFRYVQGDICAAVPPLEGEQDVVTAFDVLFHIIDPADFTRAVANIARLTRPGGVVIISDGFCSNPWGPFYHEYHRTYDDYCRELVPAGLEPFHLEPIFFTMTTTLCEPDTTHRQLASFTGSALEFVIKLAARRRTEWVNHLIGCGLFAVDSILGRTDSTGPSLKLLFARRQT